MNKTIGVLLSKKQYCLLKRIFSQRIKKSVHVDYLYDYRDYFLFDNGVDYYKRIADGRMESHVECSDGGNSYIAKMISSIDSLTDFEMVETDRMIMVGAVCVEEHLLFEFNNLRISLNRNYYDNITDYDLTVLCTKTSEILGKTFIDALCEKLKNMNYPVSNRRIIKFYDVHRRARIVKKCKVKA